MYVERADTEALAKDVKECMNFMNESYRSLFLEMNKRIEELEEKNTRLQDKLETLEYRLDLYNVLDKR